MSIIVRLIISFVLLLVIYFYVDPFSALNREADTINFLLAGVYAPLVLTTVTIAACSVLASPFWFSVRVDQWWRSKPLMQVFILASGIVLLLVARYIPFGYRSPGHTNGETIHSPLVNEWIAVPGWALFAFSILTINLSGLLDKWNKRFGSDTDWTRSGNS